MFDPFSSAKKKDLMLIASTLYKKNGCSFTLASGVSRYWHWHWHTMYMPQK